MASRSSVIDRFDCPVLFCPLSHVRPWVFRFAEAHLCHVTSIRRWLAAPRAVSRRAPGPPRDSA
jgi:hypothetical protein